MIVISIGDVVSLRSQVPAGNVAFGLAWAFHVNYLRHVLPGMEMSSSDKLDQFIITVFRCDEKENASFNFE